VTCWGDLRRLSAAGGPSLPGGREGPARIGDRVRIEPLDVCPEGRMSSMALDSQQSRVGWTKVVSILVLCGVLIALSATPSSAAGPGLTGAWNVTIVLDDGTTLCTSPGLNTADGGVVTQGCSVNESPGYGQWQRVGWPAVRRHVRRSELRQPGGRDRQLVQGPRDRRSQPRQADFQRPIPDRHLRTERDAALLRHRNGHGTEDRDRAAVVAEWRAAQGSVTWRGPTFLKGARRGRGR
jgi:hypothetical protein